MVKAAHLAPPPAQPTPEEDKIDRDAERLLAQASRDEKAPQMGETLMIALAYEFAGGKHLDLRTAYTSLRAALEAADNIRQRGDMPADNTGSQLNAVLAEVAKLNDAGKRDEADVLLEQEEKRLHAEHDAVKERLEEQARQLLERRLDQDRLRDDPKSAADRLIRDMVRRAPPGGVFRAIRDTIVSWREEGERRGDMFAMRVALVLANRNMKRAKGQLKALSFSDLGVCRLAVGRRSFDTALLHGAVDPFSAALKKIRKSVDAQRWAVRQSNLGNALMEIGEREFDLQALGDAIAAHRAVLTVWSKDETPEDWGTAQLNLGGSLQVLCAQECDPKVLREAAEAYHAALSVRNVAKVPEDWAKCQLNLGICYRALGRLEKDSALFDLAQEAYDRALTVWTAKDAPHDWANAIGGLGELALDRFALNPDSDLLDEAERRLTEAKAIMQTADEFLDDRIDSLLCRIAEVRATA